MTDKQKDQDLKRMHEHFEQIENLTYERDCSTGEDQKMYDKAIRNREMAYSLSLNKGIPPRNKD